MNKKFLMKWLVPMILGGILFTGCGEKTGVDMTASRETTLSESRTSEAEASSSAEETSAGTTESSMAAFEIGKLVGEPSEPFSDYLDGIVGMRPESSFVYDAKLDPEVEGTVIEDFAALSEKYGVKATLRWPQIASSSKNAKEFNKLMVKRGGAEAASAMREICSSYGSKEGDSFNGWIYFDYAVFEHERYVSVVLVKFASLWRPDSPNVFVEAYVYDKDEEMFISPVDLARDFGLPLDELVSRVEGAYLANQKDMMKYESFFYAEKTRHFMHTLWDWFYKTEDKPERGLQGRFNTKTIEDVPRLSFFVNRDGRLMLAISRSEMIGSNESTGNVSFLQDFGVYAYEDLTETSPVISPVFKRYKELSSTYAQDEAAAVIYVGNRADETTARRYLGFMAMNEDLEGLSQLGEPREHPRHCYIVIPKYMATNMFLVIGTHSGYRTASGPAMVVFSESGEPVDLVLEHRGEKTTFRLPSSYDPEIFSNTGLVDVTQFVKSVEDADADRLEEYRRILEFYLGKTEE